MKFKQFFAAALILLLTVSLPLNGLAAEQVGFVEDHTSSIDDQTLARLNALAQEISQAHSVGVYFVMVDSYTVYTTQSDEDIIDATANYYHGNALGMGAGRDGMLILLSLEDSMIGSYVYGEYGEYALDVYGQMLMEDAALEYFKEAQWAQGVENYLNACRDAFALAQAGEPLRDRHVGEIGLIYIAAFIIALVHCNGLKKKHINAKLQAGAAKYVDPQGLQLTHKEDQFIRSTVTRQAKSDDSDDSGPGESRRVQGGSGRSRSF